MSYLSTSVFNFDYSHNCPLGWGNQLCAKHVYLLSDPVQRAEMIALLCIFPFIAWHHWVLRTTSLMCFGVSPVKKKNNNNCAFCLCSVHCFVLSLELNCSIYKSHSFFLLANNTRGLMLWNMIACYDIAASSPVLLRWANSHCGWELEKAGMIGLLSHYNYFCLCPIGDLCGDQSLCDCLSNSHFQFLSFMCIYHHLI